MTQEILKEYKIAFEKEFINYVKTKEKEKLLYFALAQKQNNDVVIVKSPSKNEETKLKENDIIINSAKSKKEDILRKYLW